MDSPRLSIITVVYNGAGLLERTIQSVLSQDYPNVEYVIVDGASTDGTMDLVGQYRSRIQTVISEPDEGLYDAMNKGLRAATGDYVWFMNCGDEIYAPDTVSRMFAGAEKADVLYGSCMVVSESGEELGLRSQRMPHRLPERLEWRGMRHGMVVSHQSFIPKRSIAPEYMAGNLAADIDWVIRCLKASKHTHNTQQTLCRFLEGGVSSQQRKKAWRDRYQILKQHYGFWANLRHHAWIVLRYLRWRLR